MDLLRDSIGPIRRNVVRRKLHTDHPSTVCVDNGVPPLVLEDAAAQHPRPERALRFQISGVEDDHPAHEFHAAILAFSVRPNASRRLQITQSAAMHRLPDLALRERVQIGGPGAAFARRTHPASWTYTAVTQEARSMIDRAQALAVAQEWLDAWNAHAPQKVVAHF